LPHRVATSAGPGQEGSQVIDQGGERDHAKTANPLALVLVLAAGEARADPTWTYNWLTDKAVLPTQTGGLTIAPTAPGGGSGTQQVSAAVLSLFASSAGSTERSRTALHLSVDLKDDASSQMATLSFSGKFSGSFLRLQREFAERLPQAHQGSRSGHQPLRGPPEFLAAPGPANSG